MPTVGLSMIVKNGAADIRGCLESVQGVVTEIVVADTGSTDGTVEIATELGATVIQVPWANDFAQARNAALQPLKTDWVLVLDADEELDSDAKPVIPGLLEQSVGGYEVPIRNYLPVRYARTFDRVAKPNNETTGRAIHAPAYTEHTNCRLFRRVPEIYFVGRVHELVEHQILAQGWKLGMADFHIHHFGMLAGEQRLRQKDEFYRELGRLKVKERPDDPAAHIELGLQEYEHFQNYEEALCCFERALVLAPSAKSAWLFTGMVHLDLGNDREALIALELAKGDGPGQALASHLRADALFNLGLLKEARHEYRKALHLVPHDPFLESKLGMTEVRIGRKKLGFSKLRRAIAAAPRMLELRERMLKACVAAGELEEAAIIAEDIAEHSLLPKKLLRAASIRAKLGQRERMKELLERGDHKFPGADVFRTALLESSAESPNENCVSELKHECRVPM
ncbi:MAG TPA: glycosyltransferase [Terriglobales bacterium]|nr:glycosyltransferase [Terriglobales bacterium]